MLPRIHKALPVLVLFGLASLAVAQDLSGGFQHAAYSALPAGLDPASGCRRGIPGVARPHGPRGC